MASGGKIAEILGQGGFRSFSKAVLLDLNYTDILKDPFPTPQEAEVWFQIGDSQKSAFVPLSWVDTGRKTARAALIGESGGEILVSFPPTNFGQTRFYASKEDLEKIAVSSSTG